MIDYSEFYKQILDILVEGFADAMAPIIEMIQKTLVVVLPLVGVFACIEIGLRLFKFFTSEGDETEDAVMDTVADTGGAVWLDSGDGVYNRVQFMIEEEYDMYYDWDLL